MYGIVEDCDEKKKLYAHTHLYQAIKYRTTETFWFAGPCSVLGCVCVCLQTGFLKRGTRLSISRCGLEITTRIRTFVQLTSLTDAQLVCMLSIEMWPLVGSVFLCSLSQCVHASVLRAATKKIRTNWFLKTFFFFATFRFVFVWLRASLHRVTFFFSDLFDFVC